MKRKTSNVPTRIWTFGALAPVTNGELVRDQLFLAHRYYNKLIEIERERRAEYRAARTAASPELAALEQEVKQLSEQIEGLQTEIKKARSGARKRIESPVQAQVKVLKEKRKSVAALLKEARVQASQGDEIKAASEKINERVKEKIKQAHADCGVYWGTYLLAEQAVEAARKSKMDPVFKRFTGNGRVGVYAHGKFGTDEVFSDKSTVFRMDAQPDERGCTCTPQDWSTSPPCNKHRRTYAHLRIGSEGRNPIWAKVPVFLHRDLPSGVIKWAWLKIRKVGTRTKYELQLAIESESFRQPGVLPEGVVALDLGWRRRPDGVRVGFLVDDRGKEREILVPETTADIHRHLSELKSIQDQLFDGARDVLVARLEQAPESVQEKCKTLKLWRSSARLASVTAAWVNESGARADLDRLWVEWKKDRAGQDLFDFAENVEAWARGRTDNPTLLVYLDWWRRKNRHLYQWISNEHEKGKRRRKDFYRNLAADLAKNYKTVIIEDFDLREFSKAAEPEETEENYTRRIKNSVSPSELRDAIVSKLGKNRIVELDAGNTTAEHYKCGHVSAWPEKEKKVLVLKCQGCGDEYDRDSNAARVLLKRFFERFDDEEAAE